MTRACINREATAASFDVRREPSIKPLREVRPTDGAGEHTRDEEVRLVADEMKFPEHGEEGGVEGGGFLEHEAVVGVFDDVVVGIG